MDSWFEPLEYYFATRWRERDPQGSMVPDSLYRAIRNVLGAQFEADLVHPVEYDDDRIALLLLPKGGEPPILVRFDSPSTTTISFLGSLAGGTYTETVEVDENAPPRVTGVFAHERLGDNGPLQVSPEPPPANAAHYRAVNRAADERSDRIRQTFRRWATESPHQPSQPTT